MSEIQLAHFAWGESPRHRRNHDVAPSDARIATHARAGEPSATSPGALLDRLGLGRVRLAFVGGTATAEPCTCPA